MRTLMAVVLPAPLGPISANTEPAGTSSVKPASASTPPYLFSIPSVRSMMSGLLPFLPPPQLAPLAGDKLLQFLQADPQLDSLHRQRFHVPRQQTPPFRASRGPPLGDHGADAGPHLQQAFLLQLCDHLLRGIEVNLNGRAESPDRWKRLARPDPAGDDGLLGREGHLLMHRDAGLQRKPEGDHTCNIYLVTADCKGKKGVRDAEVRDSWKHRPIKKILA